MIKQINCGENNTCGAVPLEKRKIIKKSLKYVYILLIIAILLTSLGASIADPNNPVPVMMVGISLVWLILSAMAFLIVAGYQILYFRSYFYDFTGNFVVIKKGVIARNESNISYDRIQNVFIDQDFLDRFFRLYDVHLATADFQSASLAHIDGVSQNNAEALKQILLTKIQSGTPGRTGL